MGGKTFKNNSFYEYLLEKGFFFDKKTIENYLLSLKVKPFTILTGNSGTGKTKLSQLFAQYISEKGEDLEILDNDFKDQEINSNVDKASEKTSEKEIEQFAKVKVTTRKSSWSIIIDGKEQNPGWTISNRCFLNYLPINQVMGNYEIEVDGINVIATLKPVIQLYYSKHNKKLKKAFENLYYSEEEDIKMAKKEKKRHKKQFVDLDINVDSIKSLMKNTNDSFNNSIELDLPITKTAIERGQWLISYDIFNYLPFNKSRADCKMRYDDIYSEGHIEIKFRLSFNKNEKLINYLKQNQNKKDKVKVKIKNLKWDLNSFEPDWGIVEELEGKSNIQNPDKTIQLKVSEFSKNQDTDIPEEVIEKVENYKIIPVGANWTENRYIVGYHNIITDKYDKTPAYNLIKKSQDSTEPHFLILDEMNLSHVERYFADFLSAIESGEKIPIYSKDEDDLEIPNNLFIIGTVNVDETTYMFSPKVLDRANVIEFETPSAFGYMNNKFKRDPPKGNISYLENPLDVEEIRKKGIDELRDLFANVTVDGESFWEILSNEINEFQKILKESGFDFGFRVINEIVRFMAVAWEYENEPSDFSNWKRYFDACIKQKMLPKLHGSEKIIGETLNKLYKKCLSSNIDKEEMAKYPESYKKLKEMKIVLNKQRYVSFIN